MTEKMAGLTEGRNVHFVLAPGEHRPAIIVKVWSHYSGSCNMQVFLDGANDRYHNALLPDDFDFEKGMVWKTSVLYSENKEPGTWHWIEPA